MYLLDANTYIQAKNLHYQMSFCIDGGTSMNIIKDDLSSSSIATLLAEHLSDMAPHSPPESRHALSLDELRHPSVHFYSAWEGNTLLGCGAFKLLDTTHAEIKSMRTAKAHLCKGIARNILQHLIAEARQLSIQRMSLETGTAAAFAPAHRLYTNAGFHTCEPFGDYVEDPYSTFLTRSI